MIISASNHSSELRRSDSIRNSELASENEDSEFEMKDRNVTSDIIISQNVRPFDAFRCDSSDSGSVYTSQGIFYIYN